MIAKNNNKYNVLSFIKINTMEMESNKIII